MFNVYENDKAEFFKKKALEIENQEKITHKIRKCKTEMMAKRYNDRVEEFMKNA